MCVNLGATLLNHSLDVDPEDRYHFATHAAVIIELEGDTRHLHDCWMSVLDS